MNELKPLVEKIYDEYAQGYDDCNFIETTYKTFRYRSQFDNDITWHYILKYLPKNLKTHILDAGAGTGFWAEKLIKNGYKNISLSDISQGMLNEAKKKLEKHKIIDSIQYIKADITDMQKDFRDSSYDFIFSQFDPVSYCMKPKEAITELARIAKTGAYVVICVDTKFRRVPELIEAKMIKEAQNLLRTNISYDFKHPQYNFTWQELNSLYNEAGLEVIEIVGAPVFMHHVNRSIMYELEKNPNIRKELLKIELENCTNKSLINFAGHIQIIGKKK